MEKGINQPQKDFTLTVLQLRTFCEQQIKNGNENKKILISRDDEGNGYHNLYYGFTDDTDEIKALQDFYEIGDIKDDIENYILLG